MSSLTATATQATPEACLCPPLCVRTVEVGPFSPTASLGLSLGFLWARRTETSTRGPSNRRSRAWAHAPTAPPLTRTLDWQVDKPLPLGWTLDSTRSFNRYYHADTDTRANSIPDVLRVVQHWISADCEYKVHSRNLTNPLGATCRGTRRPARRKLKMEPLEPFAELTSEETDELFRALFCDPVETTISGDAPRDVFDLPPLMPQPPPEPPSEPPAGLPSELRRLGEFATTLGPRGLGVFSTPKSSGRTRARPDEPSDRPKKPKRVCFSESLEYVPELHVTAEPVAPVAPSPATIIEQIHATTAHLAALQASLSASMN